MSEFKLKTTKSERDSWRAASIGIDNLGSLLGDIDACLAEIERLRAVLRWYAERAGQEELTDCGVCGREVLDEEEA